MPVKKRDTNQMDLFAMNNSDSPVITPSPSPTPIVPDPQTEPPQESTSPVKSTNIPNASEPDASFNPADWESENVDSTVPSDTEPGGGTTEPAPETKPDDDFALFDSDPFFNPAIATRQPSPAHRTPLFAEERLLEDIMQKKPSDDRPEPYLGAPAALDGVTTETIPLQTALASLSQTEAALHVSRQEAESLRLRCSTLETERDTARRDAEKERQLRAEAIRNRPPSTFKPIPQELQPRRQQLPTPFISRRALLYALPGILVLCLLAYSLGRRQAPGSVTFMGVDEMPVNQKSQTLPAIPPAEPSHTQPVSAAWPSLNGTGYKVTGDDLSRRIVFNYGAFSRGTLLSETAQRDLAKIAATLKPDISSFRIEVVGHTDASPVRSTHAFADNHELALARATAAAEYLTGKGGLPEDAVSATAADNTTPPHPGTTPDIQKKNRTVVLNITRR